MSTVTDTSLTDAERRVVARFVDELRNRFGERLRAVWLFGSRARGERPGPESDVDLLIVSDGGSKDDGPVVNEVMWEVASDAGLNPFAFTTVVWEPAWLHGRRSIRSFFVEEVDRDKVVLYGEP